MWGWNPADLISATTPPLSQGMWVDTSGSVPVWRVAVGGQWVAVAGGGAVPASPTSAVLAQTLPALTQQMQAAADAPGVGTVATLVQTLPALTQAIEAAAAEPAANPTIGVLAQHLPALTQALTVDASASTSAALVQTLPALTQQMQATADTPAAAGVQVEAVAGILATTTTTDVSWPTAFTTGRYALLFVTSPPQTNHATAVVTDLTYRDLRRTGTTGANLETSIYTREADGTESGTFPVAIPAGSSITLIVLSDADSVSWETDAGIQNSTTAPDVTAPEEGMLVCCWAVTGTAGDIGDVPSGMTERSRVGLPGSLSSSRSHVVGSEPVSAGATGTRSVSSLASSSGRTVHFSVVAYPAT